MIVFVNPGSGAVLDATFENAKDNMNVFVQEAFPNGRVLFERVEGNDGEGRWCYVLRRKNRKTIVEMPGCALDKVRFANVRSQSAWNYPRLYVDGSSWLWCFAVEAVRSALKRERD